ncbi:MAG: TonB family protein [Candidatus Korobacteraceae bacterium]
MTTALAAQNDFDKVYPICGKKSPSDGSCATPPRTISAPNPEYPKDARQSKVEGTVVLWLIVGPDGSAHNIRVDRGLGHGLDENAIAAVQRWKFDPATIDGKPVPVSVNVEVNFRLHGNNDNGAFPGPVSVEDASRLFSEAYNAETAGDYANAIALATRATQVNPQHWEAWNLLGLCYEHLNDWDAAENAFKRQIEVSPQHVYAYNNLGRVYLHRHEYDKALVEFRKQLEINPKDHYSLDNIGRTLKDQKKYREAIAAYQEAIQASPKIGSNYRELADCYFELGMRDEALQAVDKAAALSTSPSGWNSLAWVLAERNVQLDHAERYAKLAISMESATLMSVTLDPLTPDIFGKLSSLSATWDTLGWICFLRGDTANAEQYLLAGWTMNQDPTISDHLAQLYEKAGRKEDALKYSGYTIAALQLIDSPQQSDTDAASASRERIARLDPPGGSKKFLQETAQQFHNQSTISIPNSAKQAGTAQFALLQKQGDSTLQARLMAGDDNLKSFGTTIASATPHLSVPANDGVDVARWVVLTCPQAQAECSLKLLTARQAVYDEARSKLKNVASASVSNPSVYSSESFGISLNLPQGWTKSAEKTATDGHPSSLAFTKKNTLCSLLVMRYRLEASEDTFNKIIESNLKSNESLHVLSAASVVRDGISGTRTIANFTHQGVAYHMMIETFSAGDLHYELAVSAPLDAFDRYAAELEKLLASVQFTDIHVNAKDVKPSQ